MIGLLQRVCEARVVVEGRCVGAIGPGLLLFVCAEPHDDEASADRLVDKTLRLRVFADAAGKMNRDLASIAGGGLLVVSQFTLAAETTSGNRPSFSGAAAAEPARRLYERVLATAATRHPLVRSGIFGAEMRVELVNDGPVTIPLRT
ncbi:MAG: D-aminoacyl-tRNA deacylase [Pseudomonadota bacterium]|nr:D-aminoacyl-tRNA deacylase [Pseudomonadota bacterium]